MGLEQERNDGRLSMAEMMSDTPWRQIQIRVTHPAPQTILPASLPTQTLFTFESFELTGFKTGKISATRVAETDLKLASNPKLKVEEADLGGSRKVVFLKVDPLLRDTILEQEVRLFPTSGILPPELAKTLAKLQIGEERFVRLLNLSPTGRYTSERNNFHSYCIPEHCVKNPDLEHLTSTPNSEQTHRVFQTHLIHVAYNSEYTLIVHDGESPCVKQLQVNLRDGQLEYFKQEDSLPDMTTLLKDVIEANSISAQRILRLFHKFKNQPFRSTDSTVTAAFKLVLAELQNYWITEESPKSGIETLLRGIATDSKPLGCLLREESRLTELLEAAVLTTERAQHLGRGVDLREEARSAVVEDRHTNVSTTLAALAASFLPNASVSQLPINNPMISLAAHGVATLLSLKILSRMKKLHWFDFVTENFGDLFGFRKVMQFFDKKPDAAKDDKKKPS